MNKKLVLLFCFIMVLIPCISYAKNISCDTGKHSAIIQIDKDVININDKASISVQSDNNYNVQYSITNKGIISINNEGIIEAIAQGLTNIEIKVNFVDNETEDDVCTIKIPITVISSDSTLKSLNIEEFDISSQFKSDEYEYSIEVPYSVEKINILAEANDKNAKITGDGRRYLNEGLNEYDINVTATDGTVSTYKLIVTRNKPSDISTLSSLNVEGYVMSPEFKTDIYKYQLEVGKDVDAIVVNATPSDETAKIRGTGEFKLATGLNTIFVIVDAENGTQQKYQIDIKKNNGSSRLNTLSIRNFELDKKFDSETFVYYVDVLSDTNKLDIEAKAGKTDKIEIIGNENFQDGENNVIIKVTSKDKSSTTYKIIAKKNIIEESPVAKENILTSILLIIFIVAIIVLIILVGMYIMMIKNRQKKLEKINKSKKKNRV